MTTQVDLDFVVEQEEGGLSASCFPYGIFTQARDKEDLREKIKDAVRLHFDDVDFEDDEIKFFIRLLFVGNEESILVTAA